MNECLTPEKPGWAPHLHWIHGAIYNRVNIYLIVMYELMSGALETRVGPPLTLDSGGHIQ